MLSKYEAPTLPRSRKERHALDAQCLPFRPAFNVILAVIVLIATNPLRQAVADPPGVPIVQRKTTADGAALTHLSDAVDGATSRIDRRKSEGQSNVEFFFGFLEFDWDPNKPGGVPGFDPWPPGASHVDLVTAGK
jgi:hypothetical protein